MIYERTWRISSAHLNSIDSYHVVWALAKGETVSADDVLAAMRDTHGHNYKIKVWVKGELREGQSWLIDDPMLEKVVMEYHNTNLSLLPFFLASQRRATTEELALLIWGHLSAVAGEDNCSIDRIEVWETDDICASFTPPTFEPPALADE
jgi:6-pyruvoyl-tetrahydropterin synthase